MAIEKLNPYCDESNCEDCGQDWMCRISKHHIETIRKLGTVTDVNEANNALKDINKTWRPHPMEHTGAILSLLLSDKVDPAPSYKEGSFPPGCRKVPAYPDTDTQFNFFSKGGHTSRFDFLSDNSDGLS